MEQKSERNLIVDIIRGIAMLMVVFGHTMTGSTINSQDSFLYNIVWTLQMPLFILISGYVTRYSRPIASLKDLLKLIVRRTFSYLLPWAVWSFLIRGLIFGQNSFFNIKYLVFHMDQGYWFLFSIWTISLIYAVAKFLSDRYFQNKREFTKIIATAVVYVVGMALLAAVGFMVGLNFLCIKLTLYYMPFFFVGYLFGQLQPRMTLLKYKNCCIDGVVALSAIVWLSLIYRYNFYSIGDNVSGILLRAVASLAGCITVCGLVSNLYSIANKKCEQLLYIGRHSLEIYLTHYLLLSLIKPKVLPMFQLPQGLLLTGVNFLVTVALSVLVCKMANGNIIMKVILFGKKR